MDQSWSTTACIACLQFLSRLHSMKYFQMQARVTQVRHDHRSFLHIQYFWEPFSRDDSPRSGLQFHVKRNCVNSLFIALKTLHQGSKVKWRSAKNYDLDLRTRGGMRKNNDCYSGTMSPTISIAPAAVIVIFREKEHEKSVRMQELLLLRSIIVSWTHGQ